MKNAVISFSLMLVSIIGFGQACPGCVINQSLFPNPAPEDFGLVPDSLVVTQANYEDQDATYLMPKIFIVPGIGTATVTAIKILSVNGLPAGLSWTCDQYPNCEYDPQSFRYGCVKVCGTTYASPGNYPITVSVLGTGSVGSISQSDVINLPMTVTVLPAAGGNAGFSFTPLSGCDSAVVTYESPVTSPDPTINPLEYIWDFGNGETGTGQYPPSVNYPNTGTYYPSLTINTLEYVLDEVSINVIGSWFFQEAADEGVWLFGTYVQGVTPAPGNADMYFIFASGSTNFNSGAKGNNQSPSWTGLDILLEDQAVSFQFWDSDDLSADDNGGSLTTTFSGAGTFAFSTSGVSGTYKIIARQKAGGTAMFNDTLNVAQSPNTPSIANLSAADTLCVGDSITLVASYGDAYTWFNDTMAAIGNDSFITVFTPGSYYVEVNDTTTFCSTLSAAYQVGFLLPPPLPILNYDGGSNTLSVTNSAGNNVEWYDNAVLISGEDSTVLEITGAGPYQAALVNSAGCSTFSTEFTVCISGSSSTLAADTFGCCNNYPSEIVATQTGFNLRNESVVAWVVSPEADGLVDSENEVVLANDDGLVFLSDDNGNANINLCGSGLGTGNYYLTPLALDNPVVDSVSYFPQDTTCRPVAEICPALTGVGWEINPMVFTFPDGSSIDVLQAVGQQFGLQLPPGTPITEQLINLVGGLPCINLTSIYTGDPNGTWQLTATNTGTGSLEVDLPDFAFIISTDSCSLVAQDEITVIEGANITLDPGETETIIMQVPPLPQDFPNINEACEAFGTPVSFYFVNCGVGFAELDQLDLNFNVYPNPNTGDFMITFELDNTMAIELSLYDQLGRRIFNKTEVSQAGKINYPVSVKHNPGIYYLKLRAGNQVISRKVMIR